MSKNTNFITCPKCKKVWNKGNFINGVFVCDACHTTIKIQNAMKKNQPVNMKKEG